MFQNAFTERAKRMGFDVDTSSAGALQASMEKIEDPEVRRILQILCTKAMHRAKYFCSGMLDIAKYGHYALNTPLYTHFTSPIRRYADILVHRQLEAVLSTCKWSCIAWTSRDNTKFKFSWRREIHNGSRRRC